MLRELQLQLSSAFREGGSAGEASRRILPGLRPLGRASAPRTLEVYQSALRHAVEDALREIFPVCAALVGRQCFGGIARHHARAHVSRHPDLGRIGDDLPDRLRTLAFLDGVPYLADVARLELALHRAADAADPPPIDGPESAEQLAEALSGAPDRWCFTLPPSATLLESEHPVLAIWQAHQDEAELAEHRSSARGDAPVNDVDVGEAGESDADRRGDRWTIRSAESPDRLIVRRSAYGLQIERVEPGLWALLRTVGSAAPVSRMLGLVDDAVACELQDDPGDHAAQLATIGMLFERGWIAGVAPLPARAETKEGSSSRRSVAAPVVEAEENHTR